MKVEKINIEDKLSLFTDYWNPRIVGELNGQLVKLVRFSDEFIIIPRGVEHRPVADQEVSVMLFEPASVINTGDNPGDMTRSYPERI